MLIQNVEDGRRMDGVVAMRPSKLPPPLPFSQHQPESIPPSLTLCDTSPEVLPSIRPSKNRSARGLGKFSLFYFLLIWLLLIGSKDWIFEAPCVANAQSLTPWNPPDIASPKPTEFSREFLVVIEDGSLHSITADGRVRWSNPGTLAKQKDDVPSTFADQPAAPSRRLMAGPDGRIFYYGEDGAVMPLPINVRDIVFHSPFSTPLFPDVYFLGKREAIVESLDFYTGEVSNSNSSDEAKSDKPSNASSPQLRVGQTRWVVRAMDVDSHTEKWRLEWREVTPIIDLGSAAASASLMQTQQTGPGSSHAALFQPSHSPTVQKPPTLPPTHSISEARPQFVPTSSNSVLILEEPQTPALTNELFSRQRLRRTTSPDGSVAVRVDGEKDDFAVVINGVDVVISQVPNAFAQPSDYGKEMNVPDKVFKFRFPSVVVGVYAIEPQSPSALDYLTLVLLLKSSVVTDSGAASSLVYEDHRWAALPPATTQTTSDLSRPRRLFPFKHKAKALLLGWLDRKGWKQDKELKIKPPTSTPQLSPFSQTEVSSLTPNGVCPVEEMAQWLGSSCGVPRRPTSQRPQKRTPAPTQEVLYHHFGLLTDHFKELLLATVENFDFVATITSDGCIIALVILVSVAHYRLSRPVDDVVAVRKNTGRTRSESVDGCFEDWNNVDSFNESTRDSEALSQEQPHEYGDAILIQPLPLVRLNHHKGSDLTMNSVTPDAAAIRRNEKFPWGSPKPVFPIVHSPDFSPHLLPAPAPPISLPPRQRGGRTQSLDDSDPEDPIINSIRNSRNLPLSQLPSESITLPPPPHGKPHLDHVLPTVATPGPPDTPQPSSGGPVSSIPKESVLAGFVDNGRFLRTFDDIGIIGKGGFASVRRVRHRFESDFPEYAVKLVPLYLKASDNIAKRRYFREVSTNRDLFSRQVVRYFTWWCEEPQFLPTTAEKSHAIAEVPSFDKDTGVRNNRDSASDCRDCKKQRRRLRRSKALPSAVDILKSKSRKIVRRQKKSSEPTDEATSNQRKKRWQARQGSAEFDFKACARQATEKPAEWAPFSDTTSISGHSSYSRSNAGSVSPLQRKSSSCGNLQSWTGDAADVERVGSSHDQSLDGWPDEMSRKSSIQAQTSRLPNLGVPTEEEDEFIVFAESDDDKTGTSLRSSRGRDFDFDNSRETRTPLPRSSSKLLSLRRYGSPAATKVSGYRGAPNGDLLATLRRTRLRASGRKVKVAGGSRNRKRTPQDCVPVEEVAKDSEKAFRVVLLIQMELMQGMTLREWLDRPERTTRSEDIVAAFRQSLCVPRSLEKRASPVEIALFRQLVKGLKDIHRHGIVHRDIKPENIFVNQNPLTLKIGDFGLARFIQAKTIATAPLDTPAGFSVPDFNQPGFPSDVRRVDSVVSVKGTMIGTPGYTAPEGGAMCTEKADVFSAALILLELLCPRFGTAMERYQTLEKFRIQQVMPDHVTQHLRPWADLMKRMGAVNPKERPSADVIYRGIKLKFQPEVSPIASSSSGSMAQSPASLDNDLLDPSGLSLKSNDASQSEPGVNGTLNESERTEGEWAAIDTNLNEKQDEATLTRLSGMACV